MLCVRAARRGAAAARQAPAAPAVRGGPGHRAHRPHHADRRAAAAVQRGGRRRLDLQVIRVIIQGVFSESTPGPHRPNRCAAAAVQRGGHRRLNAKPSSGEKPERCGTDLSHYADGSALVAVQRGGHNGVNSAYFVGANYDHCAINFQRKPHGPPECCGGRALLHERVFELLSVAVAHSSLRQHSISNSNPISNGNTFG